ncbi:hypothetical protein [Tenacibaculum xiamenense]|uniref:hypothetical protein n=1 Tax=Tenacibaculum xiamenense TaxID=1261553 RepID=UPI0038B4B09A
MKKVIVLIFVIRVLFSGESFDVGKVLNKQILCFKEKGARVFMISIINNDESCYVDREVCVLRGNKSQSKVEAVSV